MINVSFHFISWIKWKYSLEKIIEKPVWKYKEPRDHVSLHSLIYLSVLMLL